MTTPHKVPPLSRAQIAQFKRDGYLVLERCLELRAISAMMDAMWATLGEHIPAMRRDNPSTWQDLPEVNAKPTSSLDPYFYCKGGEAFFIRNGAEQLTLDTVVRPLWGVANQLLGEGTVIEPCGVPAAGAGSTTGPCYMNDDNVEGLMTHLGDGMNWPPPETMEPAQFRWTQLELPATGPIWLNAQGTRGSYVRVPGAKLGHAHSDGACYSNMRLQIMAYLDDVQPNGGAFQVWPGSHTRIWEQQFKDLFERGETHTKSRRGVTAPEDGAGAATIRQVVADTPRVDTHAPAGSVVLWHTKLLHAAGNNDTADSMRVGNIYVRHLPALPHRLDVLTFCMCYVTP
jgi:hypothetical protein